MAMAAAGALMPFASAARAAASAGMAIRAIAFDAFAIFDQRSIFAAVNQRFPAQGEALGKLWFTKLFPYTWLRTTAGQYAPFDVVAGQALDAAAATLEIVVTSTDRYALIAAFSRMELWPDVVTRLGEFRRRGLRLAFLSNLPETMLRANTRRTGIEPFFETVLSTDRARVEAFGLRKEEIAFVAFAAWDAAGASWFGYPTVWVNRLGQPAESFGAPSTAAGRDLAALSILLSTSG